MSYYIRVFYVNISCPSLFKKYAKQLCQRGNEVWIIIQISYLFIQKTQVKCTALQRPTNFLSLFRESLCLLQNLGTFLCSGFKELENVTLYIYLRPCFDKRSVCKTVLQYGGC